MLSRLFRSALVLAALSAAGLHAQDAADLNALARLLAGKAPENGALARWSATQAWKDHEAFFNTHWSEAKRDRFDQIVAWRDREFALPADSTGTLMYPFSGPDFLNAALFFPKADKYIFYSLEPTGALPNLDKIDEAEFTALLADIQDSMGDIFLRHYFITNHMNKELRTPHLRGNRTLLVIFMSLMDDKIVSLEDVSLSPAGDPVPLETVSSSTKPLRGVKIVFRSPALDHDQTLYYYSLDVSDAKLARRPRFTAFLKKNAPAETFIKSASYLLHDDQFSIIRKVILETTDFLAQDDSGMPYRFLPSKTWELKLYGRYTHPIKDFNYGNQDDLNDAYAVPGAARPLPFKFGYHWGDGYSNLQIAVRKPSLP